MSSHPRLVVALPLAAGLILGSASLADATPAAPAAHPAVTAHTTHTAHKTTHHRAHRHHRKAGTRIGAVVSSAATGATATSGTSSAAAGTPASAQAAAAHKAAVAAAKKAAAHKAALAAAAKKAAAKRAAAHKTHKPTHEATVVVTPPPSGAPRTGTDVTPVALSAYEARLVVLVNQARAAAGVAPLTVVAGATDVARRWSVKLAGDDALSHNLDLVNDLTDAGSANWTFAAENVGQGSATDPDGLFAAYMASPKHKANILDPRAKFLGMGTVIVSEPEGDEAYNTMDFVNDYSNSYGASETNPVDAELTPATIGAAIG